MPFFSSKPWKLFRGRFKKMYSGPLPPFSENYIFPLPPPYPATAHSSYFFLNITRHSTNVAGALENSGAQFMFYPNLRLQRSTADDSVIDTVANVLGRSAHQNRERQYKIVCTHRNAQYRPNRREQPGYTLHTMLAKRRGSV